MKRHQTFNRACAVLTVSLLALAGCSDLIQTEPPTGYSASTPDPDAFDNAQGSFELYKGAINKFREATSGRISQGGYIVMTGLLGDELNAGRSNASGSGSFTATTAVDSRVMNSGDPGSAAGGYEGLWRQLHGVRMQSMTSIESLRTFGAEHPQDFTGHLYALWGMAEVMLANFFCSGIPLTTVDYHGNFHYAAGSSTVEVYEHAIQMFDSAHAHVADSVSYRHFASVGKGWALLNMGRYEEAAQAVADVPTSWVYNNLHSTTIINSVGTPNFTSGSSATTPHAIADMGTVSDLEGGTGLPYRTGGDPRSLSPSVRGPTTSEAEVFKPARWMVDGGDTPIIMASGVEARLIEAEAMLNAGNPGWLEVLNSLRTTGQFTEEPVEGSPGVVDTIWEPGAGAVLFTSVGGSLPGLRPLEDPGTQEDRIDLLFHERAYWLFLTGRRMPDMRRLIREYGRSQHEVFPQGGYPAGPIGTYGTDVNAPAPASEILYNTQYDGCFDRQA